MHLLMYITTLLNFKYSNKFTLNMFLDQGFGRTSAEQAGYQALAIASTILIAVIAGLITGLLLNLPMLRNLKKDEHHNDEIYWNVPEDFKDV